MWALSWPFKSSNNDGADFSFWLSSNFNYLARDSSWIVANTHFCWEILEHQEENNKGNCLQFWQLEKDHEERCPLLNCIALYEIYIYDSETIRQVHNQPDQTYPQRWQDQHVTRSCEQTMIEEKTVYIVKWPSILIRLNNVWNKNKSLYSHITCGTF